MKRNKKSGPTFKSIVSAYLEDIVRYVRHLGVHPQDLEDVVQEVLISVHSALETYDSGRGDVRSWVMGIARNHAFGYLRRAHRRRERPYPPEQLAGRLEDREACPEISLAARARREVLDQLLQEVPLERRCILIAHHILCMDMRDVAAAHRIPVNTAWSRHRRGFIDLEKATRRWRCRQRQRGLDEVPVLLPGLFESARGAPPAPSATLESIRSMIPGGMPAIVASPVGAAVALGIKLAALSGAAVLAGLLIPALTAIAAPPVVVVAAPDAAPVTFAEAPSIVPTHASAPVLAPPVTTSPGSVPGPSFDQLLSAEREERRLLKRARVALADRNIARDAEARELLRRHEREFPEGRYAAERRALLTRLLMPAVSSDRAR
jgi:RNA polymerase sigma-70 factor (ECF subfamily)